MNIAGWLSDLMNACEVWMLTVRPCWKDARENRVTAVDGAGTQGMDGNMSDPCEEQAKMRGSWALNQVCDIWTWALTWSLIEAIDLSWCRLKTCGSRSRGPPSRFGQY